MILNFKDKYTSQYIKQHQYSKFFKENVYLVMPTLDRDSFLLMDTLVQTKDITEYIPSDILDRVFKKEIILAFDLSWEALFRHINILYDNFIVKYNIPESQVLLISSSEQIYDKVQQKAREVNKKPCLFEYYQFLENMAHITLCQELNLKYQSPLKNNNFNKKYINLNNQWRPHRVALLTLLEANNLIDLGYNSFSKPHNFAMAGKKFNFDTEKVKEHHKKTSGVIYHDTLKIASSPTGVDGRLWYNACPYDTLDDLWSVWIDIVKSNYNNLELFDLLEKGYKVYKKIPLKVDTVKYTKVEYDSVIVTEGSFIKLAHYYQKCYFSVVTETQFSNDRCVDISEKTFKPIIFKHPFVVASTPYHMQYLRKIGYKTFHPYINESYDMETDDSKRLIMILSEIERLCNLSEKELLEFKENLIPIVDYNFNLLQARNNFIKSL